MSQINYWTYHFALSLRARSNRRAGLKPRYPSPVRCQYLNVDESLPESNRHLVPFLTRSLWGTLPKGSTDHTLAELPMQSLV